MKHGVEEPFFDVEEDEDFLSQIAAAEAEALSGKRRRTAADDDVAEGLYTAALKGSKSQLWQQHQQKGAFTGGIGGRSVGGGGGSGAAVGGGDSCFKCGKSGHWSRDCDAVSVGGAEDSVPEKPCPCGLGVCVVLTANTERNRGRKFYKCPNREENGGCGFFEWCDNSANNNTMIGRIQSYAPTSTFPEISCPCGAGSCLVLTAKTGKNIGEQFYRCPLNQGSSCGFFKWCNEKVIAAGAPASSPKFGNDTSDASNRTYAVNTGLPCYKCGKEGHWAKDCPVPSSDTYAGSGGKITLPSAGSACFKCGKEGHWARDCPAPSSDTYAGSGGQATLSSAGSSCYKCGKEGHWARDCPAPSDAYAGSGGKATPSIAGSSCYKCGKEGHWARDCLVPSSDTYAGSGGKSASSVTGSSCFKCGKEGHWARDCPVSSSDSYPGSGGKATSSGTCYKCGKSGHWARDCPQ